MATKKCTKCGVVKPLEEFYRDRSKKDGRRPDCKECQREQHKQYYAENRERKLESHKQWYAENRERVCEYVKQWYADNRKHVREYQKQWYAENRERVREHKKQYRTAHPEVDNRHNIMRALMLKDTGNGTVTTEFVAGLDDDCWYCGKQCSTDSDHWEPNYPTVEHIVPRCHQDWNVVRACWACNTSKNAKNAVEFIRDTDLIAAERKPQVLADLVRRAREGLGVVDTQLREWFPDMKNSPCLAADPVCHYAYERWSDLSLAWLSEGERGAA